MKKLKLVFFTILTLGLVSFAFIPKANHSQEVLRKKRAKLFKAFDIYKENVNYGLINETQETHDKLVVWYNLCLELDYNAINNVPSELERYLWLEK